MSFPQASDYRPPIIPDGEIYDNPENGKTYYWTQILLPEGSTPDTATSIGGYWTVVCEGSDPRFLLRHGDIVNDCVAPAVYSWNDDLQLESTGPTGVLLPKKISKVSTNKKHITNKEYVDAEDLLLKEEIDVIKDIISTDSARYIVMNNIGSTVSGPGELGTNTGFWSSVNTFSFGPEDLDNRATKEMANGDIIETTDKQYGKTNYYRVTDASNAPTEVIVEFMTGNGFYDLDNEIEVEIYPDGGYVTKPVFETDQTRQDNEISQLKAEIDALAASINSTAA